jgi:hypothetical protein
MKNTKNWFRMIILAGGLLVAVAGQGFAQGVLGSDSGASALTQIPAPPSFSGAFFTGAAFEGAPPPPSFTHVDPNVFAVANTINPIPEPGTTALIIVGGLCVLFSRSFCHRIFAKFASRTAIEGTLPVAQDCELSSSP